MIYSRWLACTFLLLEGAEVTVKLLLTSLDDLIWKTVTSHVQCHSKQPLDNIPPTLFYTVTPQTLVPHCPEMEKDDLIKGKWTRVIQMWCT